MQTCYNIMAHDTMSYLKPKHWWMYPFRFIARCQSKDIWDLWAMGIRNFDIRIKQYKGEWVFAHGDMIFQSDFSPEQLFRDLNDIGKCSVRLVLEYNRRVENIGEISADFLLDARRWIFAYPNISFYELRLKYNWQKVYSYMGEPTPTMYQAVGSMVNPLFGLWPRLFAWLNNKRVVAQGTDKEILGLDFVGKYY